MSMEAWVVLPAPSPPSNETKSKDDSPKCAAVSDSQSPFYEHPMLLARGLPSDLSARAPQTTAHLPYRRSP